MPKNQNASTSTLLHGLFLFSYLNHLPSVIIFIKAIIIIKMDNNQSFHSQLLSIFNKVKGVHLLEILFLRCKSHSFLLHQKCF